MLLLALEGEVGSGCLLRVNMLATDPSSEIPINFRVSAIYSLIVSTPPAQGGAALSKSGQQ